MFQIRTRLRVCTRTVLEIFTRYSGKYVLADKNVAMKCTIVYERKCRNFTKLPPRDLYTQYISVYIVAKSFDLRASVGR